MFIISSKSTTIILELGILRMFAIFWIPIFDTIDYIWCRTKGQITQAVKFRMLSTFLLAHTSAAELTQTRAELTQTRAELTYSLQNGIPLHKINSFTHCFWSSQDMVECPYAAYCLHLPLHGSLQLCIDPSGQCTFPISITSSFTHSRWLQQLTSWASSKVILPFPQ